MHVQVFVNWSNVNTYRGILEDLLLNGTGIDPTAFSVAPAIKNGKAPHPNVPTFIVHGSIDDKVPIVQAEDVVNAMKENGLSVGKLRTI